MLVRAHHGVDNLHLVLIALWKERAQGPVREPRSERCALGRTALPSDPATGYLACGVHPLFVLYGEREEIERARLLGAGHRREHNGVAVADEDRSIGLPGEPAALYAQWASCPRSLKSTYHDLVSFSSCKRPRTLPWA